LRPHQFGESARRWLPAMQEEDDVYMAKVAEQAR